MNDGVFWSIVGTLVVALIGGGVTLLVRRFRDRASEPQMWERIDKLTAVIYGGMVEGKHEPGLLVRLEKTERQTGAQGRVIRDLSRQWPLAHTPRLNPVDLAELDEATIPMDHAWRHPPQAQPT